MPDGSTNPLIVALDVAGEEEALDICRLLCSRVEVFKVGLRLFLAVGSQIIQKINFLGGKVFLDLKLLDIPFQTAAAAEQIALMKVKMFTVHTMGGLEMMKQIVQATEKISREMEIEKPLVLGVTVLTSWDQNQMQQLGIKKELRAQVVYLARLAQEAELDGVVASPQEASVLRQELGKEFKIVTPGVRPTWAAKDDQRRVCTPGEAVTRGADYVVIGRPITCSKDPLEAVSKIQKEINKVL